MFGTQGRIRTSTHVINSDALYQLSYLSRMTREGRITMILGPSRDLRHLARDP